MNPFKIKYLISLVFLEIAEFCPRRRVTRTISAASENTRQEALNFSLLFVVSDSQKHLQIHWG